MVTDWLLRSSQDLLLVLNTRTVLRTYSEYLITD
jgi:hypothetical protein